MPNTTPSRLLLVGLAALLASSLAGCLDSEGAAPDRAGDDTLPLVSTVTGVKPAEDVRQGDLVLAPSWKVGDWFGVHVFTANGPADGRHYEVVVVAETADEWTLAPNDPAAAKEEAVTDLPVAGRFARADLSSTAYEADFGLFDFPLADNHTWQRTIGLRDPTVWTLGEYDVSFRAVYSSGIILAGTPHPGFIITGTLENGTVVVETDFVPALGWYAHLTVHYPEVSPGAAPLLRATSMGRGTGWSGTYYVDEARVRLEHFDVVAPEPDGVAPAPYASFDVTGGDVLHGFVGSFAFAGAHDVMLVDPNGDHYEVQATHASAEGYGAEYGWLDFPAVPGTWQVFSAGVGVVAVGVVILWEIDEGALELPATATA